MTNIIAFNQAQSYNHNAILKNKVQSFASTDATVLDKEKPVNKLGTFGIATFIYYIYSFMGSLPTLFTRKYLKKQPEFTTKENVEKVLSHMAENNNLKEKVLINLVDNKAASHNFIRGLFPDSTSRHLLCEPILKGENAAFFPKPQGKVFVENGNRVVNASHVLVHPKLVPIAMKGKSMILAVEQKASLLLHEMGHSINFHTSKFWEICQKSRLLAQLVLPFVLIGSAFSGEDNKTGTFIKDNAGKLATLAFIPTIAEEFMATKRGLDSAKEVLGKDIDLKPLKKMLRVGVASYTIVALATGYSVKKAVEYIGKKLNPQKA